MKRKNSLNKTKVILGFILEFSILIIGTIGVILQIGLFTENPRFETLNYYTIISNIICVIYILCKIIYKFVNIKKEKNEFLSRFRGSVVMCITVTMIIYHLLLSGRFSMNGTIQISNIILHYFVPIAIIFDWLMFDKKGYYKKIDPIIWLSIPLIYFAYALIIGANRVYTFYQGSHYPYYFIDVESIGIFATCRNALVIIIAFTLLGYLIYFIDKKLGNKIKVC